MEAKHTKMRALLIGPFEKRCMTNTCYEGYSCLRASGCFVFLNNFDGYMTTCTSGLAETVPSVIPINNNARFHKKFLCVLTLTAKCQEMAFTIVLFHRMPKYFTYVLRLRRAVLRFALFLHKAGYCNSLHKVRSPFLPSL